MAAQAPWRPDRRAIGRGVSLCSVEGYGEKDGIKVDPLLLPHSEETPRPIPPIDRGGRRILPDRLYFPEEKISPQKLSF